jgi:hypothetical protein
MFKDKYPLIHEISLLIKSNKVNAKQYIKNIVNLEEITALNTNTIMINDYELTSKISHFKLNNDIPISTNANTFCYQIGFSSYIYYIIINMLHGMNYSQVFSEGEFYITSRVMIEILVEVNNLIFNLYYYNNLKDTIVLIKDVLDELINGDIEDEVYKFAQEDHSKNKLVIMKEDTLNEIKEDIIDTFRNYNKSSNNNTSDSGPVINANKINEGTPPVSAAESEDEKELDKTMSLNKIESSLSMNETLEHKFGIIDESENNDFNSNTYEDEKSDTEDDEMPKLESNINTNKDILVSAN